MIQKRSKKKKEASLIIDPSIEQVYVKYFKSLQRKKGIIRKAEKTEKLIKVWAVGEINEDLLKNIVEAIDKAIKNKAKAIDLSIRSDGGTMDEGFALMDYIRQLSVPIITTAYGCIRSSAVDLFGMGVIRRMTSSSGLMIHHASSEESGSAEKIIREGEFTKYQDYLGFKIMSLRSEQPMGKLIKICYPVIYLTPEEALKMNLADEII